MSGQRPGAVVIGVDENAVVGHAVGWAAEQAHLEHRPVLLVDTSDTLNGPHAGRTAGLPAALLASLRDRSEGLMARAREQVGRHAPEAQVDEIVQVSDARTLLLNLSATADLIVLGSRGPGSTLSELLGSVGVSVVRHAFCPVVVHRSAPPSTYLATAGRGRVVAAADATEESLQVLEFAFRQASLRQQPLTIVHYVYDTRSALVGVPTVTDLAGILTDSERVLAESLAWLQTRYPDVPTTVDTVPGTPNHDLSRESARAALLVIGSHQRGVVGRLLLGSVSQTVIAHASCPVAVVPVTPPVL